MSSFKSQKPRAGLFLPPAAPHSRLLSLFLPDQSSEAAKLGQTQRGGASGFWDSERCPKGSVGDCTLFSPSLGWGSGRRRPTLQEALPWRLALCPPWIAPPPLRLPPSPGRIVERGGGACRCGRWAGPSGRGGPGKFEGCGKARGPWQWWRRRGSVPGWSSAAGGCATLA